MKFFAILAIIMVLCATILISIVCFFPSSPLDMVAEKLANKPEEYFVVTNADPVLLQAFSHLEEPIRFKSMDETQIDDLTSQYVTSNMEYQNNYYRVGIVIGDRFQFVGLMWICLIGLVVSTVLLVSLAILKGLRRIRKRKF